MNIKNLFNYLFEYPIHPTRMKIVISSFDWHASGGELISAIWLTLREWEKEPSWV